MFAKKIQGVIWMDRTAYGDQRRNFWALYIFDEGFKTLEDAQEALKRGNMYPDKFVYVFYADYFYPVCFTSYFQHIVVTKDSVYYQEEAFADGLAEERKNFDALRVHVQQAVIPDTKCWQDGIVYDLTLSDPDIKVVDRTGARITRKTTVNQAIIIFGQKFFASEICIRTNQYASTVLSHYYSNKSMQYMGDTIRYLRSAGAEYYNPFTKSISYSEKEKTAKQKSLLLETVGTLDVPEYEREEIAPKTKIMREREVNPAQLGSASRTWWNRRYRHR